MLEDKSWTSKILETIKISKLAEELGIEKCPSCKGHYPIIFDDDRGFFICLSKKYGNEKCNCAGNIVDFQGWFG